MISNLDPGGQASSARRRLVALDGARGLSALMVAVFHFDRNVWPAHGYLAVDLFFLLSGYVIAGAYEVRLQRGAGLGWFFGVRMARLYPIYLFGTLIGLAGYLAINAPAGAPAALARALVFLPAPISGHVAAYPLNGAMWSLAAEVEINILYAWFGYRLSTRALAWAAALAGAVLAVVVIRHGGANTGAIARVLFAFPLGVVVWRLHSAGRLPKLSLSPLIPLLAAALVYGAPALSLGPANGVVDAALMLLVLPLILVALVLASPPKAHFAWALSYAGGLSYALYAVHLPISEVLNHMAPRFGPSVGHIIIVLGLSISIPLAMFGHHLIEPAGRRLILGWLSPRKPAAAEPAVTTT